MREFNLDQLRTLIAVVDLGSLASASSALNLAQPTISLHLKELESKLKVRLLERSRRGVSPTTAGTILIEHAREILAIADRASEAVRNHREGLLGVVRVGASAGLIAHHMPNVLQELSMRRPDIRIELSVTTTATANAMLFGDELDFALVGASQRQSGLTVIRWREDPLVAYLPADWSVPRRVTAEWLQEQPLLTNEPGSALYHQTLRWFAQAGFIIQPRIALNNGEALKSLVAAGYGAAILPFDSNLGSIATGIQVRDVAPAMKRSTFLAFKSSRSTAEPLKSVGDILRKCGRSSA
ncbi:LysR family transcriptional regulator [Paraburkholderia terrae]|uniref:LysR family transcriptional regulator n=1 Tax=Paraburkholderia terrae TaxID=311230 RepID=A0A2I8F4W2_9BURK|nr:LysR family transcriptional regulator [Paraburkholderia terrae]AUT66750.1 LysR family transcriptional regulator [Paraburkholderia terrae]